MKYEVHLTRTETKDVQLFANDRDDALNTARILNPGFFAEIVVELLDGDEPGDNHVLIGECEFCDRFIWEGEQYDSDPEDGSKVCAECFHKMKEEGAV